MKKKHLKPLNNKKKHKELNYLIFMKMKIIIMKILIKQNIINSKHKIKQQQKKQKKKLLKLIRLKTYFKKQ